MKTISISAFLILLIFVDAFAQNFWEQTSGPEGGWVRCIAIDKQNNIFAGFNSGSYFHYGSCLYKSENAGTSWQSVTINSMKDIESIVVDTSGTLFLWAYYSGVYKSTNNGINWRSISNGMDIGAYGILGVCQNNYITFGGDYGVYISTNTGSSWIHSSLTDPVHYLYVDRNDNIFADINYGGLFKSSDYCLSWVQFNNGLNGEVNALVELNDSIYFAGTNAGVFKSTDNCNSWNFLNGSPSDITSIAAGNNNELFAGTSGNGFFVSTNMGTNWHSSNNRLKNLHITSISLYKGDSIIIGTYGDGLFLSSSQDQSWQSINSGIKCVHATSIFSCDQSLFAGSQEGMIYKSTDKGDSWTRIDSTYTYLSISSFLKTQNNSLFFAAWNYFNFDKYNQKNFTFTNKADKSLIPAGFIFKSTDEGNTWFTVAQFNVNSFSEYYDPDTGTEYLIAAADNLGIMISTDDGYSWHSANNGINGYAQDVDVNSSGVFFASTTNKIFRSTDFGATWEEIYLGGDLVYIVIINIAKNDYLYAGFYWGTIILSTDNGDNWIEIGNSLSIDRVGSITTDSLNDVFVGDWSGQIYESKDYGGQWTNIGSGTTGGPILNLECDNSGNIFVGPYGGSVYRSANNTFVPEQVELAYPAPVAHDVSLTPEFRWHSAKSAEHYRLQVSLNISFDSVNTVFDTITPDTSCISDTLQGYTNYYWKVIAGNQYGWGLWSAIRTFKTLNPLSADNKAQNIIFFNLVQNYPNPFNPVTIIKYSIPNTGTSTLNSVKLKVYNTLGEEVTTLVNEEKPAGVYEIKFDGSKLPSGVYIYKLSAGSYTASRKMIIVK